MAKTYAEKLKDPRWQKKRLKILERAKWKCELCSDEKTELHVHHLEYSGEPWEVSDDKLQCLCKHCHDLVTNHIGDSEDLVSVKKVVSKKGYALVLLYKNNTAICSLDETNGHFDFIAFSPRSEVLKYMYLHNKKL